ncbi:hypothetical protein CYMTET_37239 [Cymbomonas tetramitiformis]|uniref:Uncharacterized protein n=1 Tax=Cymbomonas tetramitiformis TaxID=36881 RepID=A0AAE0CGP4_9CHLO|nr:hypothetical protein CYMTET_37239 [Cymbomonas tetramitiformis]
MAPECVDAARRKALQAATKCLEWVLRGAANASLSASALPAYGRSAAQHAAGSGPGRHAAACTKGTRGCREVQHAANSSSVQCGATGDAGACGRSTTRGIAGSGRLRRATPRTREVRGRSAAQHVASSSSGKRGAAGDAGACGRSMTRGIAGSGRVRRATPRTREVRGRSAAQHVASSSSGQRGAAGDAGARGRSTTRGIAGSGRVQRATPRTREVRGRSAAQHVASSSLGQRGAANDARVRERSTMQSTAGSGRVQRATSSQSAVPEAMHTPALERDAHLATVTAQENSKPEANEHTPVTLARSLQTVEMQWIAHPKAVAAKSVAASEAKQSVAAQRGSQSTPSQRGARPKTSAERGNPERKGQLAEQAGWQEQGRAERQTQTSTGQRSTQQVATQHGAVLPVRMWCTTTRLRDAQPAAVERDKQPLAQGLQWQALVSGPQASGRLEPTQLLYLRSESQPLAHGMHSVRPMAQPMALMLAQVQDGVEPLVQTQTHNVRPMARPLAQAQEHGAEPLAPTHMYSMRLTQPQVRDELPPVPPAHAGPKMRGLLHLVQLLVHTAEPLLVHGTMELAQSAEPQLQLGAALLVTTRRSATEHRGAQRAAAGRERRLWELCAELQARDELQPMPHTVLPVQALEPKVQSVQPLEHVAQPLVHDAEERAQGAEQLLEHVAWQVQRRQTHEIELLVLGMPSAATQHGKPLERGSQWRTPRAKLQVSDKLKTTQLLKLRAEPHPHASALTGLAKRGDMHTKPAPRVLTATTVGKVQRVTHCNVGLQTRTQRVIEARRSAKPAATRADLGLQVCGAKPHPQARGMELLAQRQAPGAGSLAQALAWAHARCPGTGARPLATLLVLDADPRAQPLLQPQTYGAEPQVQPLAQPQVCGMDPQVCGTDPQPQARDIGLLAQRQALGAGLLAQALAWVRARCPSAGARPLAQLLAPDTEPRAQLLVQAQKHGAEPQVQCMVTAKGGARPAVASQSMELQRGADGQRNSQPMAVQWGTQLEAFAEELAARNSEQLTQTEQDTAEQRTTGSDPGRHRPTSGRRYSATRCATSREEPQVPMQKLATATTPKTCLRYWVPTGCGTEMSVGSVISRKHSVNSNKQMDLAEKMTIVDTVTLL